MIRNLLVLFGLIGLNLLLIVGSLLPLVWLFQAMVSDYKAFGYPDWVAPLLFGWILLCVLATVPIGYWFTYGGGHKRFGLKLRGD